MADLQDKGLSSVGETFKYLHGYMKTSFPIWEDFVQRGQRFQKQLEATIVAFNSFLDGYARLADVASRSKGGSHEIGTTLINMVRWHKGLELKLREINYSLSNKVIVPMGNKVDEWKKNLASIETEHNKEMHKAVKETREAMKGAVKAGKALQSRKRKDKPSAQLEHQYEQLLADTEKKLKDTEQKEKVHMIRLMVEERMWFSFLGNAFHQVLEQEAVIVGDLGKLQNVMKDLKDCSSSPSILPEAARDLVENWHISGSSSGSFKDRIASQASLTSQSSAVSDSSNNSFESAEIQSSGAPAPPPPPPPPGAPVPPPPPPGAPAAPPPPPGAVAAPPPPPPPPPPGPPMMNSTTLQNSNTAFSDSHAASNAGHSTSLPPPPPFQHPVAGGYTQPPLPPSFSHSSTPQFNSSASYSQPPLPPPNNYNHRSTAAHDMSHRTLPPPPPSNFPPGPITSGHSSALPPPPPPNFPPDQFSTAVSSRPLPPVPDGMSDPQITSSYAHRGSFGSAAPPDTRFNSMASSQPPPVHNNVPAPSGPRTMQEEMALKLRKRSMDPVEQRPSLPMNNQSALSNIDRSFVLATLPRRKPQPHQPPTQPKPVRNSGHLAGALHYQPPAPPSQHYQPPTQHYTSSYNSTPANRQPANNMHSTAPSTAAYSYPQHDSSDEEEQSAFAKSLKQAKLRKAAAATNDRSNPRL